MANIPSAALHSSSPATTAPQNQATNQTPPAPAVCESLDALYGLYYEMQSTWFQVEAQLKAISQIATNQDVSTPETNLFGQLADTALGILEEVDRKMDNLDRIQHDLNRRLMTSPGPGEKLPEFVWMNIIEELATERPKWGNEDFWRLSKLAEALRAYAPTQPEAGAAYRCMEGFFERNGKFLGDHPTGFGFSILANHADVA